MENNLADVNTAEARLTYDWIIEDINKTWHDAFFNQEVVKRHQAKGVCGLYWKLLEYMERQEWLQQGDVIFDPMCGIGTTLILSCLKGYNSFGNDIEEAYMKDMLGYDTEDEFFGQKIKRHVQGNIDYFMDKIRNTNRTQYSIHVINYDARKLKPEDIAPFIGEQNLIVITSPPYNKDTEFDEKKLSYMDQVSHLRPYGYKNPDNIALKSGYAFHKAMRNVWQNLATLNIDYMAVVTRDHIEDGKVYRLGIRMKSMIEQTNRFECIDYKKVKIPYISVFKYILHDKYHADKGLPLIDWEDIYFYRRK